MGVESSTLEECSLQPPLSTGSESLWEIRHGITFDNDAEITVFTEKSKKKQNWLWFERNIKFLRSIRHPYILHYIKDGKDDNRYLVTERATPLSLLLEDLSPIEIASGICNIISALSFLHDKAKVCHNNICVGAVYVTRNGHWKLGGFECACRFTEVSPDFLKSIILIRNESCIPPEESEEGLNLTPDFGHVRDVFSFGVMIEAMLEQLEDLDDIIKTFELRIQDECLNVDPKKRPKLQTFLEDKIFSNGLLYLSTFLHHITLKNKEEREEFYRTLIPKLQCLSEDTVGKHLVQPLLCRFVLLDKTARDSVASHILTPKRESVNKRCNPAREITPLFSEDVYQKYVIPELTKVFCCHEINIRTLLLQYFPYYVDLFDQEKLEDVIFPQILLGIRDTNEELAALSLHCLADMIPILGRDVVIGGRSKTYFIEGSPKNLNSSLQDKEPVKNVNGMIGKVKLKDLASISKHKNENNQNTQIDKKSQEEKMKEARDRREQKRLERQNKKNTLIRASSIEKKQNFEMTSTLELSTIDDLETKPLDHAEAENIHTEIIDLQQEVFSMDKDDWSDWEEENGSLNDDLSNLSHNHTSSPTSSTISIETTQSNSSTHFHSTKTNNSVSAEKELWLTDLKDSRIHDDESQCNSIYKKIPSPSQKKSVMSVKGKTKPIKPQSNEPLGAEFDIHNIEIKVKTDVKKEVDFFADMMPDIKPITPQDNLTNFDFPKSPGIENKSKLSSIFSFSYTDSDNVKDTSGPGWDNDGWDVEGF